MMIVNGQDMRTDREDPPTDLDLVKMKRRERAGLKALGVVGLTVAALIVGMSVGRADGAERAAAAEERAVCAALAAQVHETHDYTGTTGERQCFGEEDDARVSYVLEYGTLWDENEGR